MTQIHMRIGLPILCVGLLFGCGKAQRSPRYDGIVKSHADGYQSGGGHEFDLVRGSTTSDRYKAGRGYGDPEKADWTSTMHSVLKQATLDIPAQDWAIGGGREGNHTEHLGYLLAELQFLQRTYPGQQW